MTQTAPTQNRNLNDLHPMFRPRLERWLAAVRAKGYQVAVIETFRTAARQAWLYAQGRTRPGNIVTYTLDSCHEYGCATDWAPIVDGKISWDTALYNRIYAAVPPTDYGLETLAFERPHVQLQGFNGAHQNIDAHVYAAAHGIQANVVVGSSWPERASPPAALPKPLAVAAPVSQQPRVMVPGGAGGWRDVAGQRVELPGGVVVNATDTGQVWVGFKSG